MKVRLPRRLLRACVLTEYERAQMSALPNGAGGCLSMLSSTFQAALTIHEALGSLMGQI